MYQPPFARRHRIESKWLAGLAHALRGHSCRKFQLINALRPILCAIEPHAIVQPRIEPQPAVSHVFQRQQQFRVALQQQFLIITAERHHDVRLVRRAANRRRRRNLIRNRQPHFAQREVQVALQFHLRIRAVQPRFRLRLRRGEWAPARWPAVVTSFVHSLVASFVVHQVVAGFLNLLREGSGSVLFR